MSIWTRITEALRALAAGEGLSRLFDSLRTPPERTVAFTIAVIALGAKMAKADGRVTRDEVTAFRQVFTIPPDDERHAARIFDLARQDVAGFDAYARKVAGMFEPGDPVLVDLLEGLFHIAVADGDFHDREAAFLKEVATIFGLGGRCYDSLVTRLVPDAPRDPYAVLGIEPGTPHDKARAAWKAAVREAHPDLHLSRGLPEEALRMAERRMADINRAWEEINAGRAA